MCRGRVSQSWRALHYKFTEETFVLEDASLAHLNLLSGAAQVEGKTPLFPCLG